MPPSMSSRDALVIWMLRIAMKAPIMLARTAIQEVRLAFSAAGVAGGWTPGALASETFDMALALPLKQNSAFSRSAKLREGITQQNKKGELNSAPRRSRGRNL